MLITYAAWNVSLFILISVLIVVTCIAVLDSAPHMLHQ